jgi:riboflavin kinase/FMN adenylyltransferase
MRIEEELAKIKPQKETLLTIGVFDGVHLGHQHLLAHLRDEAQRIGCLSGVITFKSNPKAVLSTENKLLWLNDLETRINLLRGLGIDLVVALPFSSELAQLTARTFIQLLKDYLKMRGLIIGPDFALGRNREGDTEKLRLLGKEIGFSVEVVPAVVIDGQVVSSSAIRQALAQGDMSKVEKLFGRYFSLRGQVVSGDGRGRTIGFPTANLEIKPEQALPSDGVYATIAHVGNKPVPSVTNIGIRPTFEGNKRWVETYLLDHKAELLGQRFTIDLVDKLRDEKRFDTVEKLKAQIARDIAQARQILSKRMRQSGVDLEHERA